MIDCLFEGLFASMKEENWQGIKEYTKRIVESLNLFGLDKIDSECLSSVCAQHTKYGRGAKLLAPFGYYHPSKIITVVTDNAKRGTLTKRKSSAMYVYEYDFEGNIKRIRCIPNSTTTLCIEKKNYIIFLTFESTDEDYEIVDVAAAEHGENHELISVFEIMLYYRSRAIARTIFETYQKKICSEQQVKSYSIYGDIRDASPKVFQSIYTVEWGEGQDVKDWYCQEERVFNIQPCGIYL